MKKIIIIVLLATISMSIAEPKKQTQTIQFTTEFCDGWEDGYCEGWRDVKGQFEICPIAPLCPLPEIGRDRYRDGYNRGFKAGRRKANK
jgi:hypothetical protein